MVLMAADTIALVMQYCNRAPPGGVSRTPSASSHGMDVLIILRQRADSRRAGHITSIHQALRLRLGAHDKTEHE